MELVSGKGPLPKVDMEQAAQGCKHGPTLTELKECLYNAFKHRV